MTILGLISAFVAAIAAGFINAIAGGGTLITFPVLTAIGLPAVAANVTNTVALSPGLLSGALAQRKDFQEQKKRLLKLLPIGVAGGIVGGYLLLHTRESSFRALVPYLILLATLLLAIQPSLKNWIVVQSQKHPHHSRTRKGWMFLLIFMAATYGGYFGAGLGIILMAVLGLALDDSLTKLNVLKQAISFCINMAAAVFFVFSGKVYWLVAAVMIIGSISGGMIGGKLAGKIRPEALRWIVIATGLIVATIYFAK